MGNKGYNAKEKQRGKKSEKPRSMEIDALKSQHFSLCTEKYAFSVANLIFSHPLANRPTAGPKKRS